MRRWSSAIAMMVLVLGCENGKPPTNDTNPDETTAGDPDATEGVTEPAVTTTGGPGPDDATTANIVDTTGGETTDGATSCSFVCDTTGGGVEPECDNFAQDCNDGEKCSAYADDGLDSWNNLKCVPVQENAAGVGEECTAEAISSGIDTCALGAMCWGIDADTGTGVCVELCTGTPMAASCSDPATTCVINNDGVLNLCLGKCDPLVQDCDASSLCLPSPNDPDAFICVPDASGEAGKSFDPCEYGNACDKGHICATPTLGMECDAAAGGCCLPYCDLSAVDCPGAGQECLPWYEQGTSPPGYENVGVCGIPG